MYDELKEIIKNSDNIVFFGGAGVSTESNIPDFRSANGLNSLKEKNKPSVEKILSLSYFKKFPKAFYKFYYEHMMFNNAKPNKAHYALAKLEKMGKLKTIITQNIDGLHQDAGNSNVLELHGSNRRNRCLDCGKEYSFEEMMNKEKNLPPKCDLCGGLIKPDVILYEELLDDEVMNKSIEAIKNCDVLIIGGTSLIVFPAAGLIRYFKGSSLVLINKEKTKYDHLAELVVYASIGEALDEAVKDLK